MPTDRIAPVLCLCVALWGMAATASTVGPSHASTSGSRQRYEGICEPSGGAMIDADLFAVASDESNVVRIYRRGSPGIVGSANLTTFTGYDKSDLEAAAVRGDVVYWAASQSNSSSGKDKKRKVVFGTRIVRGADGVTLEPVGVVRDDLKPELVSLSGSTDQAINVEGLAATPDGGLLFGLRDLVDGRAAVVKLNDADDVIASKDQKARFGETAMLDLSGRGIRSLELIGDRYLIVAGRPDDDTYVGYALFWWDGDPSHPAVTWDRQPDFAGMDPESTMALAGGEAIQIVSDDGDRCFKVDKEDPADKARGFNVMDVLLRP